MLTRICRQFCAVSLLVGLTISGVALAAKPPKPPPPPPPTCTDAFPSFAYIRRATNQSPPAVMLASADACRREVIFESPDIRGIALHLTADRTAGVVLWTEDRGNADTVQWRRFSLDTSGNLVFATPMPETLVLDGPGDPGLSTGEGLFYFQPSLWGNSDHSRLYLAVRRGHVLSDGMTDVNDQLRIYEFDNGSASYADFRVLLDDPDNGSWMDCSSVANPQFNASCYGGNQITPQWDSTGAALYLGGDGGDSSAARDWQALVRVDIANQDQSVSQWTFAPPVLVFTGLENCCIQYYAPRGGWIRPKTNASDHDLVTFSYLVRERNGSRLVNAVLDADDCAQRYSEAGASASDDLWRNCLAPGLYTDHVERPQGWQSADALIDRRTSSQGGLYRRNVAGGLAGTSVLLVEGALGAVTGF